MMPAFRSMTVLMLVSAMRGGNASAPGMKNTDVHVASSELVWRERGGGVIIGSTLPHGADKSGDKSGKS